MISGYILFSLYFWSQPPSMYTFNCFFFQKKLFYFSVLCRCSQLFSIRIVAKVCKGNNLKRIDETQGLLSFFCCGDKREKERETDRDRERERWRFHWGYPCLSCYMFLHSIGHHQLKCLQLHDFKYFLSQDTCHWASND